MTARRLLVGIGLFVAGFAAGAALYALGWRESSPETRQAQTGVRVYALRFGDVVLAPAARTRCQASHEGGFQNLFCTRIGGGRHEVIFYEDSVLVWPLARGPEGPPFSYRWEPKRRRK